jgi:hypothetical protein
LQKVKGGKQAHLFLDSEPERIYDESVSCKEFWFGTRTSRKALGAYAAFLLNPTRAIASYQSEKEGR